MPFNVWFPVFTLILGQALIIGARWVETRWQRRHQLKDRRDDFQRETLLDLQDSLYGYVESLSLAVAVRTQLAAGRPAPALEGFENWAATARAAGARTSVLVSRVDDDKLREIVQRYFQALAMLTEVVKGSPDDAEAVLDAVWNVEVEANERIGELLRRL